jgi:phage gpG-like protein
MMTPQTVQAEALRLAGHGLAPAAAFLAARVKEELSVPAPRRIVLGKRGKAKGVRSYRAATPATPGDPPRKLSGRLRASITYEVSPDGTKARVGTNVIYGRRHEYGDHPFLVTTLLRYRGELEQILGKPKQ